MARTSSHGSEAEGLLRFLSNETAQEKYMAVGLAMPARKIQGKTLAHPEEAF